VWGFQSWRRRRVLRRVRLPADLWQAVLADLPVLAGLSADERTRLQELVILFLHEKSLDAAGGLELTQIMRLHIATRACLPILNLGLDYYRGWVSVIVYPDSFLVQHQYIDAAGVVHNERRLRAGEAWERGPLILSWADVAQTFPGEGVNVVIHECAHKLDMLTGTVNGLPPLHPGMPVTAWAQAFTAAYADLCGRVDENLDTAINPYASDSPAEFFAVASEAFFEIPRLLQAAYPAVYEQLRAFYRQDPGARMARPC